MFPGRKSDFQVGFWPDCYPESAEIGPPADFGAFPVAARQNPARKADFRPGSTIAYNYQTSGCGGHSYNSAIKVAQHGN
jgi:hypothetical protein